jgi:hypothetical protein
VTKVSKPKESPANEEVPLINATLERALVAAVLVLPELLSEVEFKSDHFALDANKQIARAIERLSKVDVVNMENVVTALKASGKLEQVGGAVYIAQLLDSAVACTTSNVQSWASQLRGLWEKRCLLAEARSFVASLATGAVDDHFEAYARSLQRVESFKPTDNSPLGCMLSDWGNMLDEPEREDWLLTDDITGKPALPLGRTSILAAAGGTGKTTVLVQLSISVALGVAWCGFRIESPGMVCLCCAESDEKLMKRQVWRAMNALELTDEERVTVGQRLVVIPLEGVEVNMIRGEGGNIERTEFLERFRRGLVQRSKDARQLLSLVILDPLSRFAGSDTEKDNAAATRFIQAIETLTKLPGTPAVMCAHHSSKVTAGNGKGPPVSPARGVSAIRDGVRSMIGLTRHKAESVVGVYMECDKSNEAPHFESRWLVQQQGDRGGTLRMASESEAAMLEESARPKKNARMPPKAEAYDDKPPVREAILTALESMHGVARSRRWLETKTITGYRSIVVREAFRALENDGLITIDEYGPTRGTVRMVGFNHQADLPFDDSNVSQKADTPIGDNNAA